MRSSGTLALLVALVGATACDDDPTCDMVVNLSGGLNGELAWSLAGTDQCGLADAAVLADGAEALVFVDRTGAAPLQFIIAVAGGFPAEATYMGQVLLVTADGLWQSAAEACTIVVARRELEAWSQTDFIKFDGVVDCPGGLQSVSGALEDVTMSTMGFSSHIYDARLDFENL